jgi:5'(3')-deoxyribonucleotidase
MVAKSTIWFDLDGVLANFDKAADHALGGDHYRYTFIYGDDVLWQRLHAYPNFFESMELMPGAELMLRHVDLSRVKILTALPKTNSAEINRQKREWVREHIIAPLPVVTCFTKDKPQYCVPGDVLIDDRAINRDEWERRGGTFILHESAMSTIAQLERLGLT